ncbi:MAG: metal-dependent hydrolase [Candidatus Hodarchaeales archaeon]
MPPTGFHGLTGLFCARFARSPSVKTGIVFGSVVPDIDLLGSAFIYAITGSEEATIAFHRTITHSLITIGIIFIIALLFEKKTTYSPSVGGTGEAGGIDYPKLLFGTALGMLVHVCFDFFYLDGVSLLAPLSWERIIIIDFSYDDMTFSSQKKLAAADFQFEAIFWLVLWYLATKKDCCSSISFSFTLSGKKVEIANVRNRFLWLAVAESVLMLGFLLFAYSPVARNSFIILLYMPGIFILAISVFSPLIFKGIFFEKKKNTFKL